MTQHTAVIFAKDAKRLAAFYQRVLGAHALRTEASHVALEAQGVQLVIHAIPDEVARTIEITSPPAPREDAAIKLIFTVPSVVQACRAVEAAGGVIHGRLWEGSDAVARDVLDCEGNVFQLREVLG